MELQEQIRIVAEYEGKVVRDFGPHGIRYTYPYLENDAYYDWPMLHTLTYHTSYDALMPVAKKVCDELKILMVSYHGGQFIQRGWVAGNNDLIPYIGIEEAAKSFDLPKLFTATVQGIQLLTKYKNETDGESNNS